MKRQLPVAGIICALLVLLTACSGPSLQEEISQELGIDVSGGSQVSDYDTHSGNGDGVTCAVLRFEEDGVLQEIENDASWSALPLDETAEILLYGVSDETSAVGPFISDQEGQPLVPQIEAGYYRLIDRHAEAGEGEDLLDRASFNLTLALYDTEENLLYFCKLDT